MTILFLSDIGWHGMHQRPQHIAVALAGRWRVLWIEPSVLTTRPEYSPVEVRPGIFRLSVPAIPYNARSGWIRLIAKTAGGIAPLRRVISAVQGSLIRRALRHIGSTEHAVGVVMQNFQLAECVGRFSPSFLLYDYIDNAFGFTPLPGHLRKLWEKTVRAADAVTVTSPALRAQVESCRRDGIHEAGNGVEFERFANRPAEMPADLPGGKPIVGYVGAVYPWLDYPLLREVCRRMADVQFVFIGPVHPESRDAMASLEKLGNVIALGFREYDRLPAYLHRFSAAIIPFARVDLTRSVNPVKLYEYSAAGVPTVSTGFSEDVRAFRDIVRLADTPDEFESALRLSIGQSGDGDRRESLRAFARAHDWRRKTDTLIRLIEGFASRRH